MSARDTGSVAVELTLLTPVVILLMLFVIAAGRLSDVHARLDQASYSAARTASLARDPVSAATEARTAAASSLGDSCSGVSVTVDTNAFVAGGAVTVTVRCVVDLADLVGLGLPGSTTLTSSSTSPLDRFRAVNP